MAPSDLLKPLLDVLLRAHPENVRDEPGSFLFIIALRVAEDGAVETVHDNI
jgi:hypothetical protein